MKLIKLNTIALLLVSLSMTGCGGESSGSSSNSSSNGGQNNIPELPSPPEPQPQLEPEPEPEPEPLSLGEQILKDEPYGEYEWYIKNTGQSNMAHFEGEQGVDLNVLPVWDKGITGKSVNILVTDQGADLNHTELKNSFAYNYLCKSTGNCSFKKGDAAQAESGYVHGTAVSGIIGAKKDHEGTVGIAYNSTITSFDYIDAQSINPDYGTYFFGIAPTDSDDDFNISKYDIVNMSWGSLPYFFYETLYSYIDFSDLNNIFLKDSGKQKDKNIFGLIDTKYPEETIISENLNKMRNGKGIIYVKAAGNSFKNVAYDYINDHGLSSGPAEYDPNNQNKYFIVTGAVNAKGKRSSYSSTGASLWISGLGGEYGKWDPAITTLSNTLPCDDKTKEYSKTYPSDSQCLYRYNFNGTSSAAPTVSGVAALMLEANPNLTWRDVKWILASTAKKVDPEQETFDFQDDSELIRVNQGWVKNSAGYWFSNDYGFGLVDAGRAVDMALSWKNSSQTLPPEKVIKTNIDDTFDFDNLVKSGEGYAEKTFTVNEDLIIESLELKINTLSFQKNDNDKISAYEANAFLMIEVISPSGTKSIIKTPFGGSEFNGFILKNDNGSNFKLLSNAFLGENAKGTWKVRTIPLTNNKTASVLITDKDENGQHIRVREEVFHTYATMGSTQLIFNGH